jgi:hydroxymethylpyrimidine pyrophosphatase-like HAD family hydrolase
MVKRSGVDVEFRLKREECLLETPYRLLFLDLDGTLVGKTDILSPRTLDALHRAQALGCTPVICTARNRYLVEGIAAQIGGHGYAILANGAVLYDWATRRTLRKLTLTATMVSEAVRTAHAFETAPLCYGVDTEDGRLVFTDRRFPLWPVFAARNQERLVFCNDLESELPTPPISMGAYGLTEPICALAAAWRQRLGPDAAVFDACSTRHECWTTYFNVAQADKALAAQMVAEWLGVPREQTFAIGDHINDLALLRWAGLGVCMGDGQEEAQACADYVTGTLAEDGAAQAIERFVLR